MADSAAPSAPTVVVVGAGPAGIAAARRLREEDGVRTVLLAPEGTSVYLPGAFAVATGDAGTGDYCEPVRLGGVEVITGQAEEVGGSGVQVDGRWIAAQAVVAAPGLVTSPVEPVDGARVASFWDPRAAERAAPLVRSLEQGTLTVAVTTQFYRCPPAPYGLAMRLAQHFRDSGRDVHVRLVTPEPKPVAAIGSSVSEYLTRACSEAGIEVVHDFTPDVDALRSGRITDGERDFPTDVTLVVPPHRRHRLFSALRGDGPLVETGAHGETSVPGVFVAGDAASSPFPRAAAPAQVSGIAAAEGALAHCGLGAAPATPLPAPDCFVDLGGGVYGRIMIDYPDGPPPTGAPRVEIEPAMAAAASGGFDEAVARWRESVL